MNIQNVTADDEGYYVCEYSKDNEYQTTKTYELKVHCMLKNCFINIKLLLICIFFQCTAPNETHLNLRIIKNKNTLIRPVGYHSVNWKIQVLSNPKAILEW